MLHGSFKLNNNSQFSSLLTFENVGSFKAYSGNLGYRNISGCTNKKDLGPLPLGIYWIVRRPTGSMLSELKYLFTKDLVNEVLWHTSPRSEWFALYKDDENINDMTFAGGVHRNGFRLHPKGFSGDSYGCITLVSYSDYSYLRKHLLNTKLQKIPNTKIETFGTIKVYADSFKECPKID